MQEQLEHDDRTEREGSLEQRESTGTLDSGRGPALWIAAAVGAAVGGGVLAYRAITGHWPGARNIDSTANPESSSSDLPASTFDATARPDLVRKYGERDRDIVEEASWESFPASDPPAW